MDNGIDRYSNRKYLSHKINQIFKFDSDVARLSGLIKFDTSCKYVNSIIIYPKNDCTIATHIEIMFSPRRKIRNWVIHTLDKSLEVRITNKKCIIRNMRDLKYSSICINYAKPSCVSLTSWVVLEDASHQFENDYFKGDQRYYIPPSDAMKMKYE